MILTITVLEARELAGRLQAWPSLATALKGAATQATFTQNHLSNVTIIVKQGKAE